MILALAVGSLAALTFSLVTMISDRRSDDAHHAAMTRLQAARQLRRTARGE